MKTFIVFIMFIMLSGLAVSQNESFNVVSTNNTQTVNCVVIESQSGYYDDAYVWKLADAKVVRMQQVDQYGYQWKLPDAFTGAPIIVFGSRGGTKVRTNVFTIPAQSLTKTCKPRPTESVKLEVYPNPVSSAFINIESIKQGTIVEFTEIRYGRQLIKSADSEGVSVQSIPSGLYFIRYSQNGVNYSAKVKIQ